jgi:hypothetical protein
MLDKVAAILAEWTNDVLYLLCESAPSDEAKEDGLEIDTTQITMSCQRRSHQNQVVVMLTVVILISSCG